MNATAEQVATPPKRRLAPPPESVPLHRKVRAAALLCVFFVMEIVVTHRLLIGTFLDPRVSSVPAPVKLDIGYFNILQLRLILLLRFLVKSQFAFEGWYTRVLKDVEARLAGQELTQEQLRMPIPTFTPAEMDAARFHREFVRKGIPVIIKGAAKDSEAVRDWTPDYFAENHGDFKVSIVNQTKDHHFVGNFHDVVASRGSPNKLYIHNSANIFSYNPELFEMLDVLSYSDHMKAEFVGAQLFLGVHKGTGTHAHCANNTNLFFQVYGKKKWVFTHPDYTWLMYPMVNRFFLFCASFVKVEYDEAFLAKWFPLQKYCPKYEAVLEPGDILLNPQWQWHAIENVTDETIAVASRWIVPPTNIRTNKFFDFCQLLSPAMWRLRFNGISAPRGHVPIKDETTRGLVKSQDDYIDFGRPGSAENDWNPETRARRLGRS